MHQIRLVGPSCRTGQASRELSHPVGRIKIDLSRCSHSDVRTAPRLSPRVQGDSSANSRSRSPDHVHLMTVLVRFVFVIRTVVLRVVVIRLVIVIMAVSMLMRMTVLDIPMTVFVIVGVSVFAVVCHWLLPLPPEKDTPLQNSRLTAAGGCGQMSQCVAGGSDRQLSMLDSFDGCQRFRESADLDRGAPQCD